MLSVAQHGDDFLVRHRKWERGEVVQRHPTPVGAAQRRDTLLGKILRLEVDANGPYAVPQDNPFVGAAGVRGEIWDYGLRNPWRFSFDRETGDIFIGDVGQNEYEEVDLYPAGVAGGLNFGWRCREGFHPFYETPPCPGALVDPIAEYDHGNDHSVTGGYVYRGAAIATHRGRYFFGDFASGRIWSIARASSGWSAPTLELALKVYEVKQGITPELAAKLGETPGASFHFVLNNTVMKDNRIPPRGYRVAAFDAEGLRPVGAGYADGLYWDETLYTLPAEAVAVTAVLYYQTASRDYVDVLREHGGADGAMLGKLWDDDKSPPVVLGVAMEPVHARYLPWVTRE